MKKMSEAKFRQTMKSIPVPDGFTVSWETEKWFDGEYLSYVLTKPDDTIMKFDQAGSGRTDFMVDGKWFTFDRRGVESSFYWQDFDGKVKKKDELAKIVPEQLERIAKRRDYHKTAIALPGIPFSVSPEGLEQLKAELGKANGQRSFMPSGFGTGYVLTRRPRGPRYRGDRGTPRVKPELEKLLGVTPLYVDTFDAD